MITRRRRGAILFATEDFELYHEVLAEFRDRDLQFSTVEPGADPPHETTVVITDSGSVPLSTPESEKVRRVLARPGAARLAVEEAISLFRDEGHGRRRSRRAAQGRRPRRRPRGRGARTPR